ncbi:MAG TPA: hypothetical protein VGS11_02205 [Candidatus Bathyarchaeia archaeon]|nr:hypothetical protein [Candidatus Bathyarchaeia archaeon]
MKTKMMNLRKISVLAITALLVTGISGVSAIAGTTRAATPSTPLPSASLADLITSLINSVGDDTFSVIDLTTLVNTSPLTAPAPLQTSVPMGSAQKITMASPASSGGSTQHYGPYASGSPDSGTCGNYWADDTYNRHFTVFQNKNDGSFLVVEQFKDGNFITPSAGSTDTPPSPSPNPSPGACENSPGVPQGFVNNGVTGSLHGYFVVPLPSGTMQTSTDSNCVAGNPTAPCTTTGFIDSHFTPCYFGGSGTCPVTTFFFHYAAGGQGLIINEWKNASADRGGNHGDIRSANL